MRMLALRTEQSRVILSRDKSRQATKFADGNSCSAVSSLSLVSSATCTHGLYVDLDSAGSLGSAVTTSTLPAGDTSTWGSLLALGHEELLSHGSLGHPEVCNRPCLFIAQGVCVSGASCHYCHLPHEARSMHPDKRQREMLANLSLADVIRVVIQSMQSRAEAAGMMDAVHEVMHIMEDWLVALSLQTAPGTVSDKPRAQCMSKLNRVLSKMSLRAQVAVALRHPRVEQLRAKHLTEALNRMQVRFAGSSLSEPVGN
eukprot:gb/GFBE01023445.1/.p1 GENE.gb/GFBE01023445.1/~~gb/GFBE01023445.1/.p1  ORF type:complete len:257 (+),score=30.26 gb/GFBE01023445.1/:1-771(+)